MSDGDYLTAWHMLVLPVVAEFRPDLILVSAGFDAVDRDPLGMISNSTRRAYCCCCVLDLLLCSVCTVAMVTHLHQTVPLSELNMLVSRASSAAARFKLPALIQQCSSCLYAFQDVTAMHAAAACCSRRSLQSAPRVLWSPDSAAEAPRTSGAAVGGRVQPVSNSSMRGSMFESVAWGEACATARHKVGVVANVALIDSNHCG